MNGMPSYSKVVSFPSSSTSSLNWGKQENLNFSCGALSLVVKKVIYHKAFSFSLELLKRMKGTRPQIGQGYPLIVKSFNVAKLLDNLMYKF